MTLKIQITRCGLPAEFPLPAYETAGAAGMDLRASEGAQMRSVYKIGPRIVRTGISIALPKGYEAQVRGRSGLASRGIFAHVGTLDQDYRGEIGVILYSVRAQPFIINPGDRIAQLVIAPVARAEWDEVESLDETERGNKGFGSTGQ